MRPFNHHMSSQRQRTASRTSSRVSSVASVSNMLDEFENRATTPGKMTTDLLLIPKKNLEYEQLRKQIQTRRRKTRDDIAAIMIQKTWRMYRVLKRFRSFFSAFLKSRIEKERMYFNIILLNSQVHTVNRNERFSQIQHHSTFCPKLLFHYDKATTSLYAHTGLYAISRNIDQNKIICFVKKVYAASQRRVIEEWYIAARRIRKDKKACEKFQLDLMSRKRFGNFYVTFNLWRKWTKIRRCRIDKLTHEIPQWNHHLVILRKMKRLEEKAENQRMKSIKINAVEALRNAVILRRTYKEEMKKAAQSNLTHQMKYALSAWMRYIVQLQNKGSTTRLVFRRWLQAVQRRKHTELILATFNKRHEYYQKRRIMHVFLKNHKVTGVLNLYQYCRIQQKPSQALYFISEIRNDSNTCALTLAFSGWMQHVRRKRRWQHFVFHDKEVSEYDQLKELALNGFRDLSVQPAFVPIVYYSTRFRAQTLRVYKEVMQDKIDPNKIFLLVTGNMPKTTYIPPKNKRQQRKNFFELWRSQKCDMSLFLRLLVLYVTKRKTTSQDTVESYPDQVYLIYKKACQFLNEIKLASDGKFNAAMRAINENNHRAILNRQSCMRRNNLLVLVHETHHDATEYHEIKPVFKSQEQAVITKKIMTTNENMDKTFKPLIPLPMLGTMLEMKNERKFTTVNGCTTPVPVFSKTIHQIHQTIKKDLIRSEIGHEAASRFDRLLAGSTVTSRVAGAKNNTKYEPYFRMKGDPPPKPRPSTGIQPKLLGRFPINTRRARVIGGNENMKSTFQMTQSTDIFNDDEEEEIKLAQAAMQKSVESFTPEKSQMSMHFKSGLNSFANIMASTSISMFQQSIGENSDAFLEGIEEIEEVEEEENEKKEEIKEEEKPKIVEEIPTIEFIPGDIDGFDKELMDSVNKSKPIQSPKPSKKYKMFLEILFGKNSREANTSTINAMRRKLINEYRTRRPGLAAHGIDTKGITRPVTSLMEKYREDSKISKQESMLFSAHLVKKQQSRLVKEELSEFECTYNARRFRKIKDPNAHQQNNQNKDSNQTNDKNEQNEEDNSDSSGAFSFREDLMEIDHNEHRINIDDQNQNNENHTNSEEILDSEFDAASVQNTFTKGMINYEYNTATPFSSQGIRLDQPLEKVNKVALKILKNNLKDEGEEGRLVDVDPEEMPSLNLGPIIDGYGHVNMNETEVPHFPYIRGQHPKQVKLKQRKNVPIVIPDKYEITDQIKKRMAEEEKFSRLMYTNGTSTLRTKAREKNQFKPYVPPYRLDPNEYPDEDLLGSLNFPLEDQVVSFKSGSRHIGRETTSFMPVRITRSKLHAITKPIANPQQRPQSVITQPFTTPQSTKRDYNNLKNITGDLIKKISMHCQSKEEFEIFRRRMRQIKKINQVEPNADTERKIKASEFYEHISNISSSFSKSKDIEEVTNNLSRAIRDFPQFLPLIIRHIEVAERDQTQKQLAYEKAQIERGPIDQSYASQYIELSWLDDVDPYKYEAVAVQYEEGHDEPEKLEAILATTEKKKKDKKSKNREPPPKRTNWDELIKDYDIGEMLSITPYVFTDQQIDDVIKRTKNRSAQH